MIKFTILHCGLRVGDKLKVEAFWRVYRLTTSNREEASNQTDHGHSGPNIFWPDALVYSATFLLFKENK